MKYQRRKPLEAVQWFEHGDHPAVERWAKSTPVACEEPFTLGEPTEWYYGMMYRGKLVYVNPGDYIVGTPGVGYYPLPQYIFESIYEPMQ